MLRAETITCTRHADGSVTADHFPQYAAVASELLPAADPALMHVDWIGLRVTILDVPYVVVEANGPMLALRRVDA